MDFGTTTSGAGTSAADWRARDAARLSAAMQLLDQQSPSSALLLDTLVADGTRIMVIPDSEYYANRPYTSGASYDMSANAIKIPRSRMHGDVARAAVMLAHEAQHHRDMPFARETLARTAGGVVGAVAAAARLDDPAHGFEQATRARRDEHEVSAYQLQARVAVELGRPELGGHGSEKDGRATPPEQVRESLGTSDLYRSDKRREAIASRIDGERPPSDLDGSFDGATTSHTVDSSGDARSWNGPPWHAGWGGAVTGAALGATLVAATPLRRTLPATVAAGAIIGATAGWLLDRSRLT